MIKSVHPLPEAVYILWGSKCNTFSHERLFLQSNTYRNFSVCKCSVSSSATRSRNWPEWIFITCRGNSTVSFFFPRNASLSIAWRISYKSCIGISSRCAALWRIDRAVWGSICPSLQRASVLFQRVCEQSCPVSKASDLAHSENASSTRPDM